MARKEADACGGVVPEAMVTITNTDTALTRSGTTAGDGCYLFPALPVGNYRVDVSPLISVLVLCGSFPSQPHSGNPLPDSPKTIGGDLFRLEV